MSDFQDFLTYVQQHPSIEVVVVGQSWSSLRVFANTFPDIHACVLSNLHRHEFKGPHHLIVLNSDMASPIFFSQTRHQNEHNNFHTALSQQPQFDATVVFLNLPCTAFCLGAIEGRNLIEHLWDCPIPQNNTVPSVWRAMVNTYSNQIQQRRLHGVLAHEVGNETNTKKKM